MPCFYSHYSMSEAAEAAAPEYVRGLIKRNAPYYHLGAQGPDPFLFFIVRPPYKKYMRLGSLLQGEKAGAALSTLLRLCAGDDRLRAYYLGYLCHYALDCAAHPYIMSRICDMCHTRYETQINTALLMYHGVDPLKYHPASAVEITREQAKILDPVWDEVLREVCGTARKGVFGDAVVAIKRSFSLIRDVRHVKRTIARPVEKLAGVPNYFTGWLFDGRLYGDIDYLNLKKTPWKPVWESGPPHTESFPQLFDAAVADVERMFAAAENAWDTDEYEQAARLIGGRDYGTAIDGAQPDSTEPSECAFGDSCCTLLKKKK